MNFMHRGGNNRVFSTHGNGPRFDPSSAHPTKSPTLRDSKKQAATHGRTWHKRGALWHANHSAASFERHQEFNSQMTGMIREMKRTACLYCSKTNAAHALEQQIGRREEKGQQCKCLPCDVLTD